MQDFPKQGWKPSVCACVRDACVHVCVCVRDACVCVRASACCCVCVRACVVVLIFPGYGETWREPRAEVLVSSSRGGTAGRGSHSSVWCVMGENAK